MAKDYAGLKTALEDAGFDVDVRATSIRPLLTRLNAEDAGQFTAFTVPRADVLRAIGPALRTITGDDLLRLRILLDSEQFDFSHAELVTELREIVTDTDARTRLIAVARRPALLCERWGFTRIDKRDLWRVLRQISKSHLANPEPIAVEG